MKYIKDFEGLYFVTKEGKIYNKNKIELNGGDDGKGYKQVCLTKNKKQYMKKVHRLVAENFIDNPENKPQVNHKDGNKRNNSANNLEWVTAKENVLHSYKMGLQKPLKKEKNPMYKKTGKLNAKSKSILMILEDKVIMKFESIELAVKYLKENGRAKANSSSISLCANKIRYKSAYGYKWRFENDIV